MKHVFLMPPREFTTKTGKKVIVGYANPVVRGKNYAALKRMKNAQEGIEPKAEQAGEGDQHFVEQRSRHRTL